MPRYKSIIDANEARRLTVKQNSLAITKEREKPFSFYERDAHKQKLDDEAYLNEDLKQPSFRANPIPRSCSVLIYDQMNKEQEQRREERIRKNAELAYQKAHLPKRMEQHEEKKKQMPMKAASEEEFSFKPFIGEMVTREKFKKQQDSFMRQLEKKKTFKQKTIP